MATTSSNIQHHVEHVRKLETNTKIINNNLMNNFNNIVNMKPLDTVSNFYILSKQLDNLYNDLDPTLSLLLPIPKKPFVENNTGPFNIPQLMSIVVGAKDSDSLYGKPPASTFLEKETSNKKLKAEVNNHNAQISDIISVFNEQIDEYKEQDLEIRRKNVTKK